ncbi:hypothetical protein [Streptomyces sp. NPDC047315]|uniref:hypothetical protein n=1 Tax=Streptomyces sp. NPDC047315 TaxID=3155142 RepID=UPI0034035A6E
MRRGLVHAIAWSLSTGAAVTLTWWGVHTVMSGTAYDRPRAVPINAGDAPTTQAKPRVSSTHRPPPTSSAQEPADGKGEADAGKSPGTRPAKDRGPSAQPSDDQPAGLRPSTASDAPAAKPSGEVRGETVEGGRAVFVLHEASAELELATPNPDWQVQVYRDTTWIRVVFTKDGREQSVFCVWNAGPPKIEFYNSP